MSIYLSISLSLSPFLSLSLYLSICPPVYLSIYLSIYCLYLSIVLSIFLYIFLSLNITLKIHPKGSGPPFCSYKTWGLEKNLQFFSPYKMVGACASTTAFHHPSILYGGILSPDVRFFPLSMNFACMLGPCAPKKAPFCKNLFLYHFLSFFSIVIKEQPILFVRTWGKWCVQPVLLQSWRKVKRSYPCFFLPRRWVVLESQADRDKWHGCQLWDLSSYNSAACLHQGPCMQAQFIVKKKKRSNIRAKYTSVQNGGVMKRGGWCTQPHHFVRRKKSLEPNHSVGFSRPRVLQLQSMGPHLLRWISRGIRLYVYIDTVKIYI